MNRVIIFCLAALTFAFFETAAQVKIGDNPNTIKSASLLELESTNRGFVFPRVSLTNVASAAPLGSDILQATVVYNTNATVGNGAGLYVWTGSAWAPLTPSSSAGTDAWKLTGNSGTDPSTNFIGTTDTQPLLFKVGGSKAGYIDFPFMSNNTSFGFQALNLVSGGTYNTATGSLVMYKNTTGSHNSAYGATSLFENNTGSYNAAFSQSLVFNTTGSANSGYGFNSLRVNTSGNNNVAIGAGALGSNTTGNNNTALGADANVVNGNLTNATAIGYNAKVAISNALVLGNNANVGIGTSSPVNKLDVMGIGGFAYGGPSLRLYGTGAASHTYAELYPDGADSSRRAWLGYGGNGSRSLSMVNQIATGDMELVTGRDIHLAAGGSNRLFVQGSTGNIGIGTFSPGAKLHVNGTVKFSSMPNGVLTTDGDGNLSATSLASVNANNWSLTGNSGTDSSTHFIGTTDNQPLLIKVYGKKAGYIGPSIFAGNTSFGYQALNGVTYGNQNTAVGSLSLHDNLTGNGNTAVGRGALRYNTQGSDNIAIGHLALLSNTTGGGNTAVGAAALITNREGINNTAVGPSADVLYSNLSNATAIGYNAKVAISNAMVLGDGNIKVGIGNSSPSYHLDVNGNIRCGALTQTSDVRFKQNIRPLTGALQSIQSLQGQRYLWNESGVAHGGKSGEQQIGLIAQEVEKIYPELVSTDAQGYKAINYAQLTPVLIEAIKEQQNEMEAAQAQNEALKKDVDILKAQMKLLMEKAGQGK